MVKAAGVTKVETNRETQEAIVTYDPDATSPKQIADYLAEASAGRYKAKVR